MKNKLIAAIAALTMIGSLFSPMAEAKSFGSSGRSSSSSSSRSSSPSRSSGSWGSSSKSTPKAPSSSPSGGWGKSSPSSSPSSVKPMSGGSKSSGYTKPASKVEYNRYKDSVKSGKAFTTKESATADFKTKYASQYSSKFTSEPKTRPNYIPNSYSSGGRNYTVIYNPGMGYGYWNGGGPGLGTFLLYDALSDAAMTNRLMANQGYYVGSAPPRPFPWAAMIITVVIVGGVITFVVFIGNRN